MTTKPPSAGLAASGSADDADQDVTKEHTGEGQDINVDPSDDVTVEASEDVTTEAASQTPAPSFGDVDRSPGQRAPTLLGVPIQSLPLPGVTASSLNGDNTRTIDYDEEVTVLAPPKPLDPLAALDAAIEAAERPSITDDDEEETKVEPAEAAMKAAETMDDVTTALSAQASLEREKALRRSAPALSPSSDDLEFADPEADDDEPEESLDDELDDDDEVISAGGAIEEEEDDDINDADDGVNDGVATSTFMKPADSTGLSGLLNPRRPPTGAPFGRDGFGTARLPTPYPAPSAVPAPSTSPFASRLGPAPSGSTYASRPTGSPMPVIQVPPPSGAAATATEPGFLTRRVPVPAYGLIALVAGVFILGYGMGGLRGGGKSAPATPTVIVAKPAAGQAPAVPAAPVVEPVGTTAAAVKPAAPTEAPKTTPPPEAPNAPNAPNAPTITKTPDIAPTDGTAETAALWKPNKKPAALKVHKPAATDTATEEAALKPAAPKPPKPAAAPAAPKAAKKPAKVWVDPFAQ